MMQTFSDFFKGINYFFKGFSFLFSKGLWYYMLYPFLLWIILFVAVLFAIGDLVQHIVHSMELYMDTITVQGFEHFMFFKKGFALKILSFFVSAFLSLTFFFIGGTLVKYLTFILLSPMLARLSEVCESKTTSNKFSFSFMQFVKDVVRGIYISIRNMIYEYSIIVAALVACFFFPPVVFVVAPFLFFISAYYYGCTVMDYNCERHKMSVAQSLAFVRSHKALVCGVGFCMALSLKLPTLAGDLVGVTVGPAVACVGASLAFLQIKKESREPVQDIHS